MWPVLVVAALVDFTLATSINWSSLNKTLNGRLQVGIPFARSCFSTVGADVLGSFSTAECAQVQANYATYGKPNRPKSNLYLQLLSQIFVWTRSVVL